MVIHCSSFKDITEKYRAIFFDAYGVLKSSDKVFNGVYALLSHLKKSGKPFFIISNDASESPKKIAERYFSKEHGEVISESNIVTSGMLALKYLKQHCQGKNVAYLGPEDSAYYIEEAGNICRPIGRVDDLGWPDVVMYLDDTGYDWQQSLNRLTNLIRKKKNLVLLSPNPDLVYPVKEGVNIATGALARMIELTGKVPFIYFGKPNIRIFDYTYALAQKDVKDLKRSEVLMVGDTLATDIAGAKAAGMHALLVFTGNTTEENYEDEAKEAGILPDYFSKSVLT